MFNKNKQTEYVITPPGGFININFKEIWRYKELLYVFSWRDVKIKYKQTALGVLWAIFQPFITMVIFSIFFGGLAKVPSDGIPYPVFVYSGLLLWTYFSTALTNTSNSLVAEENMIKKIYFPRLILPFSTSATPLIDFFFALIVYFGIMIYYHYTPGLLGIVLIPALLIISLLTAIGVGLFLASLNAIYRDVRYILPFFIQILLFVTPVIYPVSLVPQKFQWLINLNPMSSVITTVRSTMLHRGSIDWGNLGIAFLISLVLLILGIAYFRRTERFLADVL